MAVISGEAAIASWLSCWRQGGELVKQGRAEDGGENGGERAEDGGRRTEDGGLEGWVSTRWCSKRWRVGVSGGGTGSLSPLRSPAGTGILGRLFAGRR
jgi:hypothetical protein